MAPGTWHFQIERERTGKVAVLRLIGRLGEASAHLLREALEVPEEIGVVVDLGALDYISGAGLDVLDQAAHIAAKGGRRFVLCGLQGSVRIAFDLAGLSGRLTVESNRERALTTAAGHLPPSATRGS
ncbi:MAG: STAS domain-containing protein [Vicinamibacterales bacterium]